jgi:hypothetical protein
LVKSLREHQRQDKLDLQQLSVLSGLAWGTYAYGPGCKGDLLVTLHIELVNGTGVSFQSQGKPETVMAAIAADMVRYFQRTTFPTVVMMGDKSLILVGTAGSPINTAPNPVVAEKSCAHIQARLPTLDEYEFLSIKGDWNNGCHWITRFGRCLAIACLILIRVIQRRYGLMQITIMSQCIFIVFASCP